MDQFTVGGPVHGWWTFPFERLIGMLQDVRANYIPGKDHDMCYVEIQFWS